MVDLVRAQQVDDGEVQRIFRTINEVVGSKNSVGASGCS